MGAFAAWAILAASAAVQVHVAPDQPIPHVYIDDPLIIELKSDADVTANVVLEISAVHLDAPVTVALEGIRLRAHSAYWWAVREIPAERGRYAMRVSIDAEGERLSRQASYCRIDRPVSGMALPVGAHLETSNHQALLALRSAAVSWVRVDASEPEASARLDMARSCGLRAVLRVNARSLGDYGAEAEVLAETFNGRVDRWEIDPRGDAVALAGVARGLNRGGVRGLPCVVVDRPETLAGLLTVGAGRFMGGIVLEQPLPSEDAVPALRTAAEIAGYENMPLYTSLGASSALPEMAPFIRQMMLHQAYGVSQTELPSSLVFDGELTTAYAHLNAVAHVLIGAHHAGTLEVPSSARAFVFRVGDGWTVVAWTSGEPVDLTLPLSDASIRDYRDAANTAFPVPPITDGNITISVSETPVLLSGRGGTLLLDVAWRAARGEAAVLAGIPEFQSSLPAEMVRVVTAIVAAEEPNPQRLDFFTLLQAFPVIERDWHAGTIARSVAVSALSSLSRLARSMALVEQEHGTPFLERFQDNLSRCDEHKSVYLTGSAASDEDRARGDWLLAEVDRLTERAKRLKAEGRPIEADAVVAMAVWRARSLEHAAKAAPLHKPDPYQPSEPEVEAEAEE